MLGGQCQIHNGLCIETTFLLVKCGNIVLWERHAILCSDEEQNTVTSPITFMKSHLPLFLRLLTTHSARASAVAVALVGLRLCLGQGRILVWRKNHASLCSKRRNDRWQWWSICQFVFFALYLVLQAQCRRWLSFWQEASADRIFPTLPKKDNPELCKDVS